MGATTCRWATDVGRRREHNEDAYIVDEMLQLYVVADGMGGHACGEVASGLAAEAFRDFVEERSEVVWGFRDGSPSITSTMVRKLLEDGVHAACRAVWRRAQESPEMRGMGTTLVALLVAGDRGFVVHVGDSRAYLLRDKNAVPLTRDHSVFNELLRTGDVTADASDTRFADFRHALSRAVGVCEDVEVDTADFEVLPGDVFVLASDGLTLHVKPEEFGPLAEAAQDGLASAFVALANERGGLDNVTAVVVRVLADAHDPARDDARSREFAMKIAAFRSLPLFRHLDYGELIRVLAASEIADLKAGEVVLREGQDGDAMYLVLSGRVALDKAGERVAEFRTGSHFGEVSLIDRAPRSATATVLEPSRLLRLKRDHLYALIESEPEIAVKLLWSFAHTLGERLRNTTASYVDVVASAPESVVEQA